MLFRLVVDGVTLTMEKKGLPYLFRVEGWGLGKPVVCGEASAVVAGVLNNLNLSILVQESVGALNITLNVSGLHLEGSIRSLVT